MDVKRRMSLTFRQLHPLKLVVGSDSPSASGEFMAGVFIPGGCCANYSGQRVFLFFPPI